MGTTYIGTSYTYGKLHIYLLPYSLLGCVDCFYILIYYLHLFCNTLTNWTILSSVTTNTSYKLHILGKDSNTLGMDGTQVGVLKKTYVVCLRGLLQGKDGRSLEPKILLEILGNLTYQTLEGELMRTRRSVDFWYRRISRRATVPGR